MAIIVNGYEHRTLAQPLYVDGKQVMEAYANGVKVYPDGYVTHLYGSDRISLRRSISWDGDVGEAWGSPMFGFRLDLLSGSVPSARDHGDTYEIVFDAGSGLVIDQIWITPNEYYNVRYQYRNGYHYEWSDWGVAGSIRPKYPSSAQIAEPFDYWLRPDYDEYPYWTVTIDAVESGGETVIRGMRAVFRDFYDHKPWGSEGGDRGNYSFSAPITFYQLPKTE